MIVKDKHVLATYCIVAGVMLCCAIVGIQIALNNGGSAHSSKFTLSNSERTHTEDTFSTSKFVCDDSDDQLQSGRSAAAAVEITLESVRGVILPPGMTSKEWLNNELFWAIAQIESGNDPMAIGDNGKSQGKWQISRTYWYDACEYGGVDWDYDSFVRCDDQCKQIMLWYWERYGAKTQEQKARIHNGGPGGMNKESTKEYWEKIKTILEQGEPNE